MPTTRETGEALRDAAERAQRAPSILNTQPWRWRLEDDRIRLYADRSRQLQSIDPDGRLLLLSCGAALHHARVALSGLGFAAGVDRFPDPDAPDLVATIRPNEYHQPRPLDIQGLRDIRSRHSDRRPFEANVPVPADALDRLTRAVEAEHARLYPLREDRVAVLAEAAERAAAVEAQMPDYQAELAAWTNRPRRHGDGVTAETLTAQVPRRMAVRDFTPERETLLAPGFGNDRFAEFLIVVTAQDGPAEWVIAGEATSAAWLTATRSGLVMSVTSEVVEIPAARAILRRLLDPPGQPQLVLRVGLDMQPSPAPKTPRRAFDEVVETEPDLP
jgi:hypothetical protein